MKDEKRKGSGRCLWGGNQAALSENCVRLGLLVGARL